ncbi:hypothetical protein EXIGLDRAFT_695944 [Exidia glandulosa HHB12029]|uniref:Uncharacterized protein n=1 Tax=Exidia glandulosa HHB12029 TaxID=1314781 RepID=A0A166BRY6_EXIGL|nr:hypothetical protein EXIGLDRAFT_695944 [Exidia glandulosa HHB12029]
MSWKEQISHFVEKGQHFIEHNGVEILQQANLQGLHKTINNFDYDDVQDWGLSHINDYVDGEDARPVQHLVVAHDVIGLHPDISGFLAKEVTKLENMLLDSLEGHVIGVFDHTFKDRSPGDLFHDKKSLNSYSKPHEETLSSLPQRDLTKFSSASRGSLFSPEVKNLEVSTDVMAELDYLPPVN